jgi:class 3 adenylate cyclase/tetratricopeptide (TPR) repeat protein
MPAIDTYIPMDRRHALACGDTLPNRSQGAVLFADLSGFSLLAHTLARELGPQQGAEELTRHLNRVYGAVIAEIHRYGGSVISFSGDAITCWFARAPTPVANGRSALACAFHMQQGMAALEAVRTPQGNTIALALKVAVAVGSARRFLVGQPGLHKLDLLAGSLLDRVAAIEHQLYPGEVAVDASLIAQLGNQTMVREWRTSDTERCAVLTELSPSAPPTPWPPLAALPADLTRDWLLPPVYQRLQQEPGGFLAELRPSVAVFHKFSGIDYDDEAAGNKLDTYIRWVQTTLAHYEGFLIDITMGDKGSHLYIAFGAPIAHEDDATRAVTAALALHHLPPAFHFITTLQTGISQGQMYAGAYGGSQRRTYGVLGDEVNIAAQLMQRAEPGQILVSERVAQAAGGYVFQSLGPMPLKGVSQSLSVFAATGQPLAITRAQTRRSAAPLVGRRTEQAALLGCMRAVTNGESGMIIVEGEAGIGKSRLVEAALQPASSLCLTVLSGAGDAIDQSTPYHAWRPIVTHLLALDARHDSPARQRQQVLARLQADCPDYLALAPLLNALLPLDFPDNERTQQMQGEVRQTNLHTLLLALLRHIAAASPLCIVLDDAHWLDSASWALTKRVWQETHPLLLVLVTRPLDEPLPTEYRAWRDSPLVHHLLLDTMPLEDIERLLCYRLGIASLPPRLSHLIHAKAEGHPFFSEELIYALRDAGLLRIANGTCQFTAADSAVDLLNFSNTIQGVITSRIDRLPPPHILTLKVASVIGRVFACPNVRAVYPVDADRAQVGSYLQDLADVDITPLETAAPELTYRFKHIITQEVVYHLMASAQRQQLHRATATWYEQTHTADASAYYPILAYHWKAAQVADKAVDYYARAGEQALRHHANQEAVRFFSDALHLTDDPHLAIRVPAVQQACWHRQLGAAYYELGNLSASRAHVEQALRVQGYKLPTSPSTTLMSLLGHIGRQCVHRLWPGRRAVAPAWASEHQLEAARAYALLGEILYFTADTLLGVTCVISSLNLAETAGPSPELARAYANTCIAASVIPLHRLARLYSRFAQHTASQSGQVAAQVHVGNYTAVYAVGVGHWAEAEALLTAAGTAAAHIGDQRQWITSQAILAVLRHYQGEFTQAVELNRTVYDAAVRSDNLVQQGWGLYSQAENDVCLGRYAEALALLEKARTVVAGDTKHTAQLRIYGGCAIAYWRHGEPLLARQMADHATALIAQSVPNVYSGLEAYAGIAEVYLGLWEQAMASRASVPQEPYPDSMREQASRACQVLRRYARLFPIGRPRARLWQGLWYWLAGRPDTAHRWWRQSLTAARQFHMPYEQGLAYYEIGRHLPPSHPQQQECLQQALALFAHVGAISALARTQELLTDLTPS